MLFDHNGCYQVLVAHDRRFDGVLFVGVTTTGIYCRPVCPARTPRRDRCRFFPNAASAENSGFRPCLRCRPELAPGNSIVDAASRTAASAAARIEAGALNEAGVDDLAAEFGLSSRQLRRVVKSELGVTPVELAQTQRLLLAKQLLTDSSLPAIEVAFASGFSSVRQFNSLFRERYGLSPTDLRRPQKPQPSAGSLRLELDYRPPFDWPSLLRFLRGRAIPGVEFISENCYLRTAVIGDARGWFLAEPGARDHSLRIEISLSLARRLPPLLARIRNLFDLNAQPQQIEAHLCNDERLRLIVARQSGLRLPGAFDVFEMAVRAVLGQQVSVRAATTLAGRVANAFGDPIQTPHAALTRTTMAADRLASATTADIT
ncbi:MAG: bifunctional transcriptional activator/DNA repair enzyme AdaA, partial [Blastocatellia bacterium]